MRAVLASATGAETVDADLRGPGVRVRVTSAGICGSDLHAIAVGAISVVLGHEFGGLLDNDELVAVKPFVACGECDSCAVGEGHLCKTGHLVFHGATINGGLAEEAWVDERALVRVAPEVRAEDVALVEPIAVAVHAVNRAGVVEGERALVVGGGTIGLVCAAVLRERGAEVTVTARHPAQFSAAEILELGTDRTGRYRLVVDAAGTTSSFEQAASAAQRGGRIVLVALPWEPLTIGFGLVFKEVDVLPSSYYTRDDFAEAARFLARHPELSAAIVTHRFGLDEAAEAFRVAGDRAAGAVKVLLAP